MKRYFLNALWLLVFFPACSSVRTGKTVAATEDAPRALPSAEQLDVGHVSFVRGAENPPFVLISLERGVTIPDGARLEATSSEDGSITRLKALSQKRGGYQVANIVSGRPRLGDLVVLRYGTPRLESLEEIPPLLRPGEEPKDEAPVADEPPPALARPDRPRLPSPDDEGLLEPAPPAHVFTPPAIQKDVEPRAPVRETDPLELPNWEPDEGDQFMETLPQ